MVLIVHVYNVNIITLAERAESTDDNDSVFIVFIVILIVVIIILIIVIVYLVVRLRKFSYSPEMWVMITVCVIDNMLYVIGLERQKQNYH